MRFWDTSALVPLLCDELHTSEMTHLLRQDVDAIVWWGTAAECVSAIRRRERSGLPGREVGQALEFLDSLANEWIEVQPTDQVKVRAIRLLSVHPLKTTDAFQLSAATSWREGESADKADFVSLDQRLADAARREGFRTLPAPG